MDEKFTMKPADQQDAYLIVRAVQSSYIFVLKVYKSTFKFTNFIG